MIIISDWIASIPEEERHLAYRGENLAETRQFLLKDPGYAAYQFYVDMAFDLSTVTQSKTAQKQTTETESERLTEEGSSTTSGTTTVTEAEETTVTVDCEAETDIALLEKETTEEGVLLTWTVLYQHTLLPGTLRATIRAVGPDGEIRKTAMMHFLVDPAVDATAAVIPMQSEFSAMETRINALLSDAEEMADEIETLYTQTGSAASGAEQDAQHAADSAEEARNYALKSEAYANGRMNEELVTQGQVGWHDNASYYCDMARTERERAQGYANGTIDIMGVPYEINATSSVYYHNNAAYYAAQAATSAAQAQSATPRISLQSTGTVTLHHNETAVISQTVSTVAATLAIDSEPAEFVAGLTFRAGANMSLTDTVPEGFSIVWENEPTWTQGTVYEVLYRCLWVTDGSGDYIVSALYTEVTA